MPQQVTAGNFNANNEVLSPPNAQNTAVGETPYKPLEFNWANTKEDFQKPQFQYLANIVFENYTMHLAMQKQSTMERENFMHFLSLLYSDVAKNEETKVMTKTTMKKEPGTETPQQDPQVHSNVAKNEETKVTTETQVKIEPGTETPQQDAQVHMTDMQALPHIPVTRASLEEKYHEHRAELVRLVSTVLYLTELYAVAQTRGGAQVSQYRRTLTAQSHTMLVRRLARELQETEMGFLAWLGEQTTPQGAFV